MIEAILGPREVALLRAALADYTVESVAARLGTGARSDLGRGDLLGARRELARHATDTLTTLIALFLLGRAVDEPAARRALAPLELAAAAGAGLVQVSAGSVRALLDLRPHGDDADTDADTNADADTDAGTAPTADGDVGAPTPPWWVVSDLGSDVRPGPLAAEHVLGVGTASLTLAQAVPRQPVRSALDLGTGSGVQALHLSRHATMITATDISRRALRLAATTAALPGQQWELREGSLLEPVRGTEFDLVVANLPFVVSAPGGDGWTYRDSGFAGDAASRLAVQQAPTVLTPAGSAHLLANWAVRRGEDWTERVGDWVAGTGCDAWVWQREVADPAEYVSLWLRDAGLTPADPQWEKRYGAWREWLERERIDAIGMGYVSMWRTDSATPTVVLEDVEQPYERPAGMQVAEWVHRQRWLTATGDAALLDTPLALAGGVVRERFATADGAGWRTVRDQLTQTRGMRWSVEVDDAIAALVCACARPAAMRRPLDILAAALGEPLDAVTSAALPVVRDLVGRGFLLPRGPAEAGVGRTSVAPRPAPRSAPT